ncbi:MAG: MBL fold metallo-hydrolase [Ruminococcaceae bacterium]|nr:MBL fold metallo-hydrolase [Oscillospiraceae bacterium]
MLNVKVTDVREHPGDAAFLLDDGKTAVLFDTGFGFTGFAVAEKVKKALGERALDYIFLTHSHYDHALGAPYVKTYWPDAKVVAGEYAARIFAKDSAKALMRKLDREFATTCGVGEYEDLIDNLQVDIAVADGDSIKAGDMTFTVVALPGHTKCSIGFYLASEKLLVGCETLGVYDGDKTIMPSYLVGVQMALDSIAKAKALDIEYVLAPHFGILDAAQTAYYLENMAASAKETADEILAILSRGGSKEEAFAHYEKKFYHGKIKEGYPRGAMELNAGIIINLIEREFLAPQG